MRFFDTDFICKVSISRVQGLNSNKYTPRQLGQAFLEFVFFEFTGGLVNATSNLSANFFLRFFGNVNSICTGSISRLEVSVFGRFT